MPKTRAERNIYSRQWRKDAYNEKRFNKGLREYLEIKYIDIFNEYVRFCDMLNEAHPEAKDITKTKTYKQWKKSQQGNVESPESSEPPRNVESPEPSEPPRNVESPEPSKPPRNVESPGPSEPPRNVESPGPSEPPRNVESPEPSEPPRNVESPEPSEPPRNVESPEPSEPPRNVESPEPNGENQRDILAEALGEPLLPVDNLNIDELDNIVQDMIDDLRRDDDVRALLDNEGLFQQPHREEDEGIAMDMEVEIGDLDLRLEEYLLW